MKKLLSNITMSPCNLETKALCAGAWVVKFGLQIFEGKHAAAEFTNELFRTQDKSLIVKNADRIHVPKIILRAIIYANDISVTAVSRILKTA